MPSPIGHTLAGYALTRPLRASVIPWWRGVLFLAVVTNLPDIDFLLGMVVGDPGRWHRGFTHSLVAVLVVAGVFGGVWAMRGRHFLPMFLVAGLAYGSHLVVDAFVLADSPQALRSSEGMMLLWPFSERLVAVSVPLFLRIHHGGEGFDFVLSVITRRNLVAVIWEVFVLLPVVVLAERASRRAGSAAAARTARAHPPMMGSEAPPERSV